MSTFCFIANSEADTERLAALMAGAVRAGDVITLNGQLGAGKTRLVRALVANLHGSDEGVNSPTFVIVQRYDGTIPVDHIDAYRLSDSDEFLALGAEEILGSDSVCLIEWAERVSDLLPADRIEVEIAVTSPSSRQFQFTGPGKRAHEFADQLQRAMNSESPQHQ